jgi:hypothetical protein
MQIETLLGPMDEDTLTKEVIETKTPDGKAIKATYFYKGDLVRQDITFEVEKAPSIGGSGWKGH